MMSCRLRSWLALMSLVALAAACEINPQPGIPATNDGGSKGGSGAVIGEDDPGTSGSSNSPGNGNASSGGTNAGVDLPPEGEGGSAAEPGAGGAAGGEGGDDAGGGDAGGGDVGGGGSAEGGQSGDTAGGQAGASVTR